LYNAARVNEQVQAVCVVFSESEDDSLSAATATQTLPTYEYDQLSLLTYCYLLENIVRVF